jgi:hypothetical protein
MFIILFRRRKVRLFGWDNPHKTDHTLTDKAGHNEDLTWVKKEKNCEK